jgi:hypothetical protein
VSLSEPSVGMPARQPLSAARLERLAA